MTVEQAIQEAVRLADGGWRYEIALLQEPKWYGGRNFQPGRGVSSATGLIPRSLSRSSPALWTSGADGVRR